MGEYCASSVAVVDNIPVMFAVLTMEPEMSGQLAITLTAGGGSLLSLACWRGRDGSSAWLYLMGHRPVARDFAVYRQYPVICGSMPKACAVWLALAGKHNSPPSAVHWAGSLIRFENFLDGGRES